MNYLLVFFFVILTNFIVQILQVSTRLYLVSCLILFLGECKMLGIQITFMDVGRHYFGT